MANTAITTSSEWIENAGAYQHFNLNPKQQLALKAHAMAIELAAIGGTDYTSDFESLIQASDTLNHWINPDQMMAAEIAIHYANATNAGGSPPAAIGDKLEEAKKLICYDEGRLKKAVVYLTGALGYHSSF